MSALGIILLAGSAPAHINPKIIRPGLTGEKQSDQFLKQAYQNIKANIEKAAHLLNIPESRVPKSIKIELKNQRELSIRTDGAKLLIGRQWLKHNYSDNGRVIYELAGLLLAHTDAPQQPGWMRAGLADYVRSELGFRNRWSLPKSGGSYEEGWTRTADFFSYLQKQNSEALNRFIADFVNGTYSEEALTEGFCQGIDQLWAQYQKEVFEKDRDPSIPYSVTYDVSECPDLKPVAEKAAALCEKYYPIISQSMWHPEGYRPINNLKLYFVNDMHYPGVCHGPSVIVLSADWFRERPDDLGAVLHELTHTAQEYKQYVPWITEGMTDYMRYKLGYRPEGAEPKPGGNYNDGYGHTANFIFWIEKHIDKAIYRKLDKAHVLGEFKEEKFKEWTGIDINTLWKQYQNSFYKQDVEVILKNIPEDNELREYAHNAAELIKQHFIHTAVRLGTPLDQVPRSFTVSYRQGAGICAVEGSAMYFDPAWVKDNLNDTGVVLYELGYILKALPPEKSNWLTNTVPELIRMELMPAEDNTPFLGGNYLTAGKTGVKLVQWLDKKHPGIISEMLHYIRCGHTAEELIKNKTGRTTAGAWKACLKEAGYQRNKQTIHIDYTQAPDLKKVAEKIKAKAEEYYAALINELDSDNFMPISDVYIIFDEEAALAAADGNKITLNPNWFRNHKNDIGCIVHELTHIVQMIPNYHPYWFIEGTADYMRYKYGYRPRGAAPRKGGHYSRGYGDAANFIEWIVNRYDRDFVVKVNAVAREGAYTEQYIKELIGSDINTLWNEYQKSFDK